MTYRSDLLRTLDERGFIHQCTDASALDERALKGAITGYIGFDCTADSLHVGNLVSIMMLRIMQETGHRPIALVGGGTTKVGDPSFRDDSRPLLNDERIEKNKKGIKQSLAKFLDFETGGALLSDNAEWLDELRYVPFLRDFGSHFTVNRMLSFDSVKIRLEREQPLTLLEFNYMVMQAYDFLELSRRQDCILQMGGSDQWGNIVNGVELGRRIDHRQLFGLTTPLITTASGAKMGKTAAGAIWLNSERLAPFDYWQFWRNTEDQDVGRFLRLFTDLPLNEIAQLEQLQGAELNEAKQMLADKATTLCHSADDASRASGAAAALFGGGDGDAAALPQVEIEDGENFSVIELYVKAGLVKSNGEARKLIRGGGARINGEILSDETLKLERVSLQGSGVKLSAGKKRHVQLRLS